MDRQIRNMDAMLRCPVCFEFFNTAMIVNPCSHNFCSLCIRRHLEYEQKCPACRHPCSSSDLKNNRLLDEFVKVFSQIGEGLLKLAAAATEPLEASAIQRRNHEEKAGAKVSPSKLGLESSVKKRPGSHLGDERAENASGNKDDLNSDGDLGSDDDDFVPPPSKRRRVEALSPKKQPAQASVPAPALPSTRGESAGGDDVDCPLCQKRVSLADINQHIDSGCTTHVVAAKSSTPPNAHPAPTPTTSLFFSSAGLNGPVPVLQKNNSLDASQPSALKSLLSRPPEKRKPLPLLCYHLLTDKQLRKAIKDTNLNPNGDRNALIWRHKEYTLRYNSECDSLNPMSQEDLLKEIDIAERTMMNQKKKQKPMIFSNTQTTASATPSSSGSLGERSGFHSSQEEETPDTKANEQYLVEHKKDFDSLVASVRERMRKQKEAAAKESERPPPSSMTPASPEAEAIRLDDKEEVIEIQDDEIKGEDSSAKGTLRSSIEVAEIVAIQPEEWILSSGQEGGPGAGPRSQDSEHSSTWSSQSSTNGEVGGRVKRKKRSSQPERPEGAEPDSPVSPEGGRRRSARLIKENAE